MYRGITSPLAGVAAINAICFGVYGNVSRRLKDPESMRSITIAGMSSGFVQVCTILLRNVLKKAYYLGTYYINKWGLVRLNSTRDQITLFGGVIHPLAYYYTFIISIAHNPIIYYTQSFLI